MARLEFTLDPADTSRLARWPGIRPSRSFPVEMAWHDTQDGLLASDGMALVCQGSAWQLSALHAPTPGAAPEIMAEARRADLLGRPVPDGLLPVIRFSGRRQALLWTGDSEAAEVERVKLHLLEGSIATSPPISRVTLEGPAATLPGLAMALAAEFGLRVPSSGLAEQALATARGGTPGPRATGAPQISEGLTVSDSLSRIMGHLLDVMVHWAALVPGAQSPEAVHQMRVATRRLRSALSVYKRVASCPEVTELTVPLKTCATRLGTARDWDVFLDGLGAHLAKAFPGDARCSAMLRAASKRRRAAYSDLRTFLAGPDFRTLTVGLACAATLRPWDGAVASDELRQDTADFSAGVLARRMKRVRHAGRGIDTLPIPALHELRKDCKRLRYAAEFFAPLFPPKRTKRFLQRLSDVQEELGLLNDSAAVSGLMAQLGRLERSYAAGLVEGFSAAHAGPARARIEQSWKRFKATDLFWVH